ncbi:histidine kinase [Nonomuraea antimicrobica]|uniref:histidine kinase n=1 Tax=Nonomuraea antimicrobica TaxID=561173 RepID=A0ABP7E3T1_9ACTN
MVLFRRVLGFADGDLLLAGAVAVASLLDPARRDAVPLAFALLGAVALPGRERWPVATVLLTCGAFGGALAYGGLPLAACVPALVGVYTAAVRRRRLSAAAGALLVVAGAALWPAPATSARLIFTVTWLALFCVALLIGETVAARREEAAARERERLATERERLAREVHDVVGHSVTGIAVQSAAALHLLGDGAGRSPELRETLTAIRDAGRTAMRELQATLGWLHGESPGLDRLDALEAAMRDAGLPVTITREGPDGPVPAAVGHAAYRIVQEALTNTLRHAGAGATAEVSVRYGTELTVEVTDEGGVRPREEGAGGGCGIEGMRARAADLGGSVTAGPAAGGGFRVLARLPVDPA